MAAMQARHQRLSDNCCTPLYNTFRSFRLLNIKAVTVQMYDDGFLHAVFAPLMSSRTDQLVENRQQGNTSCGDKSLTGCFMNRPNDARNTRRANVCQRHPEDVRDE